MERASRDVIVGAVLFGLLSFAPMRSAFLSVDAAPGLSLLRSRSIGSSTWLPPARTGMPMLDRLLRRPASAGMGNAITPPAFDLRFDGVDDRVTFGKTLATGTATFTVEVWFMREGPGKTASTGTGGLVAVPLVTKGVAEADGSNLDANYFLGIDGTTQVLAADFEDMATGLNHPVLGTTRLWAGVWYHAAVRQHPACGARRRVHLGRCGQRRVPGSARRSTHLERRAQPGRHRGGDGWPTHFRSRPAGPLRPR